MMASRQGYSEVQPPRDTQRVPRSCVQCSRRKIKCSKRIPCDTCTRRGDSLVCTREVVRVNGQITIAVDPLPDTSSTVPDLANENIRLRARIEQLEALAASDKPHIPSPISTSGVNDTPSNPQPPEDIVTTFEGLHLGDPVKDWPENSQNRSKDAPQRILSLLPIRQSSLKIVRFSLATLGWVHCALNGFRFFAEHDAFWNALESNDKNAFDNHGWMSVYFSVLAVGVYFMEDEAAGDIHYIHEAFSGQQAPAMESVTNRLMDISHTWYGAAFRELNHAGFFSKPQLSTVQTLAILMILHRNFGESHREFFLLGLTVNVARTLGLDHLGQEGGNSQGFIDRPERNDRSDRELGRRLWWTLVICDWMTVFSRPSSINPESFSSVLSIQDDSSHRDIILDHMNHETGLIVHSPSPLEYHVVLSRLAFVIHNHVRHIKTSPASVFEALKQLERISQNLALHLQSSENMSLPSQAEHVDWILIQRSQLTNLLEVCRIDLCFSCLPRLLETGRDEFDLQKRGLQAAIQLANLQERNASNIIKKFWGTTGSTIAAGVFLILDLVCFKSAKSNLEVAGQLQAIETCIRVLQDGAAAKVSGARILKMLLHLYNVGFGGGLMDKKRLLELMKLAAIPVVSTSAFDTHSHLQHGATGNPTQVKGMEMSRTQLQLPERCAEDLGLDFRLADISASFDTGFAMDLDYMTFDDLQYLSSVDFSNSEFENFGTFTGT